MSTCGILIEPASQYLKNSLILKYILKAKSKKNSISLSEMNLGNHKSKSRAGLMRFSKLMSMLDTFCCMFEILTVGTLISPSSGVKSAVYFENSSKAAVDLATKL